MSNDPKVYLSVSEGRYRVVQGGMPISADKRTAAEALAVAEHFRLKVSDKMWDGDAGAWRSLQSTRRDPKKTREDRREKRSSASASSIWARGMAERGEHARERFLAYAEKHGDLTRTEAERALTTYKKHRIIRLDSVTGDFHVKHGAFLDRETLRRAAGLE